MFKIPPIDVVINDEISRSMALRWLHHFSKELKIKGQCVLYSTPAVPFSLMVLPYLYQDLLERLLYIEHACGKCLVMLLKNLVVTSIFDTSGILSSIALIAELL